MEVILLEGLFHMFPTCENLYNVSLTRQNLMFKERAEINQPKKLNSILMQNVIGSKMFESKVPNDQCCFVQIIALIKNKKGTRQRQDYTFRISVSKDKQENLAIAELWARTICWLLKYPKISVDELQDKNCFPPEKRFHVMLNPKSGSGKSLQLFKTEVEPLFRAARIKYTVTVTDYAGHCREVARTFDRTAFDGIIICSGDGLAFEYINGIMSRPDWQECIKLPIGILPTGSGNALSASISHAASETKTLLAAVFIALKGTSHPMDLFLVENETTKYFSFLSVTWGLISDVDIESEKYRKLGSIRFTIGALQRILKLRLYAGQLSYLLGKKNGTDCRNAKHDEIAAATAEESQEVEEKPIDGHKTIQEQKHTEENSNPASAFSVNCAEDHLNERRSTLPTFSSELPAGWKTIQDQFVTISLTSLSHLGETMHSSPSSYFDDGLLNVQIVRKGITKKRLLDVLVGCETGKHLELEEVENFYVTAFRLEPDVSTMIGNMAVDGERVDYGKLQGEVLPSLANIIMISS